MIGFILTVLAGTLCVFRFHFTWQAAITFLWLGMLIRIGIHDHHTLEIPDRYNLILGGIGLVSMLPAFSFWSGPALSLTDRLYGFFIISLPMFALDLFVPGGFGGGDIKLMAAAGLFLGWRRSLLAAVVAFFAAGLYSIILLITGRAKRKSVFAFGPFLCMGLALAALTDYLQDQIFIFINLTA